MAASPLVQSPTSTLMPRARKASATALLASAPRSLTLQVRHQSAVK